MDQTAPQPETITRLFEAVYPSFAMLAGMELDLFSALEDGPLSVEQVADALDVQAVKLRPLLYALVVAGLLVEDDGLFRNTAESGTYLVRGKPAYLGGLQGLTASNWALWLPITVLGAYYFMREGLKWTQKIDIKEEESEPVEPSAG